MPAQLIVLPFAMPLGRERFHHLEDQRMEFDFLVLPEHLKEFTTELSKQGFRERKFPPIKRHHKIFQKLHGSQCITLDIQIGPRFDRGVVFHLAPIKALLKVLYSVDTGHSLDLTASGRAILYAANCAWLKNERLKEKNLKKLQELSQFAISCGDQPTLLRPILERLTRVSEDYAIDEARAVIVEMIQDLFVLKLNNPYNAMKRFSSLICTRSAKILYLGPDGSGKTSLLRATQSVLPVKSSHGYLGIGEDGWKLGLVKSLSAKRKRRGHSFLFWYIAMPLELVVRRLLLWRSSRGRVLLIDRVPGVPLLRQGFLPVLYHLILPRPDMVVLLTGDPELIAARKPEETTPERTEREIQKWKIVAKRLGARQIVEVDTTDNEIETCCNQVVDAIIQNGAFLDLLYATPQEGRGSK